jgi:AAA family ATP:ADP antiporter
MVLRLRRFFDIRPGEGLRVLFSFLYVAVVAAAFVLAKPLRNGLFLHRYGAYALVYVFAAVPIVLSVFVPLYARATARFGSRASAVATLIFFALNVILFWIAFHRYAGTTPEPWSIGWLLPALFYVWVNCFGVIAPVQAWTFVNSVFDVRQARRLFGVIASGASLGAVAAGLLARFLVNPVGGTVNMLLVLAALIAAAAVIVTFGNIKIPRSSPLRRGTAKRRFTDSVREIARSSYLRYIAGLVFLAAVTTQWTNFQFGLLADRKFGGDADALTAFFGTFNFALGAVSFLLQLLLVGPVIRRFGLSRTLLALPIALATGSALIVVAPGVLSVLLTNAFDQGFRFSLDKATYELLYLPLPSAQRNPIKATIDIVVSRIADAVGAVALGVATQGFVVRGFGMGLRGTASLNLLFIGGWLYIAWRLRSEYVRTIQMSIHRNRIDSETLPQGALDQSAAPAIAEKLTSHDEEDVLYGLELLQRQRIEGLEPALRALLSHQNADIRRCALSLLSGARDSTIGKRAIEMLRDPDLGVRTEALLYVTREMRVDPLHELEKLGDFEDFSIRAGMAAFLASPGPSQNLDAARIILEGMARSTGEDGLRDRLQAARALALVPGLFTDLLLALIADEDPEVARQAIGAASVVMRQEVVAALVAALSRPEVSTDAAEKLARYGNPLVPELARRLQDEQTAVEVRRELPQVLVRIGTPLALEVLIDGLLQADAMLRHRVIASLNKLHDLHPDVRIDSQLVELVLAAEIAGHYRSYQVLGALQSHLTAADPVLEGLKQSMDQELERIFRLIGLIFEGTGVYDAYVGLRSANAAVRANALEFLDNVLKPELRRVLVPLLDSQISMEERMTMANRLVGAPLETTEQAVSTLLASEDPWLRSCGVYAVGVLHLHKLEPELHKFGTAADPALRDSVQTALQRLSGEPDPTQATVPAGMASGVG